MEKQFDKARESLRLLEVSAEKIRRKSLLLAELKENEGGEDELVFGELEDAKMSAVATPKQELEVKLEQEQEQELELDLELQEPQQKQQKE